MASTTMGPETVYHEALVNYLISMTRTVEGSVLKALEALEKHTDREGAQIAAQVFLREPHVNEMEIVIDNHAVRMLRRGNLVEEEIRLIVATLKLTNDLERMGDLAVNISERVVSLSQMPPAAAPGELQPMIAAVRAMLSKSLGSLIYRNVDLATAVLESDDVVDRYRDLLFERLLAGMAADPRLIGASFQFVLATRYLERIADHATNIAEDTIFWVRGLDVRHGRALAAASSSRAAPLPLSPRIHNRVMPGKRTPDNLLLAEKISLAQVTASLGLRSFELDPHPGVGVPLAPTPTSPTGKWDVRLCGSRRFQDQGRGWISPGCNTAVTEL